MLSLEGSGNEFDGLADDHEVPDHPALHNHAMMVGIQSAIDIATDLIAEERLRRPASYRETFEILGESGILPEPLTRDLSALAGFRNVLVHIYWDLDLEQVYAILHQDLVALKGFFAAIQEHLQEQRLSDQ